MKLLFVSAQVAITKCWMPGGLKQWKFVSYSSGVWKEVQDQGASKARPLSHLVYICLLALSSFGGVWRSARSLVSHLIRTLTPSWGPYVMTSSNPNHLPRTSSPNISALGIRASAWEFGRGGTQLSPQHFLVLFSDWSLRVHRKTTDCCIVVSCNFAAFSYLL